MNRVGFGHKACKWRRRFRRVSPIVVYPPTGTLGMPPDYVQPPYGQIV